MYLEADIAATAPADTSTNNGTTKQRLSTIEIIMTAGVLISAVSLGLNIWNSMRKAAAS